MQIPRPTKSRRSSAPWGYVQYLASKNNHPQQLHTDMERRRRKRLTIGAVIHPLFRNWLAGRALLVRDGHRDDSNRPRNVPQCKKPAAHKREPARAGTKVRARHQLGTREVLTTLVTYICTPAAAVQQRGGRRLPNREGRHLPAHLGTSWEKSGVLKPDRNHSTGLRTKAPASAPTCAARRPTWLRSTAAGNSGMSAFVGYSCLFTLRRGSTAARRSFGVAISSLCGGDEAQVFSIYTVSSAFAPKMSFVVFLFRDYVRGPSKQQCSALPPSRLHATSP